MSNDTDFLYGANSGSDDLDLGSIVLTPFEEVNDAVGTITKATRREVVSGKDGKTHGFAELTIAYTNGNDEEKQITASLYLGATGEQISNTTKSLLIQLREATGSSTIKGTEGARVRFSAKKQDKRPDQGNFTKFSLPA